MVGSMGTKWSKVAAALEGRTDDAVRNRCLTRTLTRTLTPTLTLTLTPTLILTLTPTLTLTLTPTLTLTVTLSLTRCGTATSGLSARRRATTTGVHSTWRRPRLPRRVRHHIKYSHTGNVQTWW